MIVFYKPYEKEIRIKEHKTQRDKRFYGKTVSNDVWKIDKGHSPR